jgi:hypothetical protein
MQTAGHPPSWHRGKPQLFKAGRYGEVELSELQRAGNSPLAGAGAPGPEPARPAFSGGSRFVQAKKGMANRWILGLCWTSLAIPSANRCYIAAFYSRRHDVSALQKRRRRQRASGDLGRKGTLRSSGYRHRRGLRRAFEEVGNPRGLRRYARAPGLTLAAAHVCRGAAHSAIDG